jgi:hypothetical protein
MSVFNWGESRAAGCCRRCVRRAAPRDFSAALRAIGEGGLHLSLSIESGKSHKKPAMLEFATGKTKRKNVTRFLTKATLPIIFHRHLPRPSAQTELQIALFEQRAGVVDHLWITADHQS